MSPLLLSYVIYFWILYVVYGLHPDHFFDVVKMLVKTMLDFRFEMSNSLFDIKCFAFVYYYVYIYVK